MNKTVKYVLTALFAVIAALFVYNPTRYMQSFFDGLSVWAYNVLPALFPFMVLTALASKLAPKARISATGKLFGVSCDGIFALNILCGYPIGAKALSESEADAAAVTRACSFCSSASPIFVIATVGSKLLQNTAAALILFSSQIAALLLNGLLYKRKKTCYVINGAEKNFKASDIGDSVTGSALSVISVGGLIALFYMLSDMIKSLLPTSVKDSAAVSFCIGLLEMTNGIIGISRQTDLLTATVLSSALLSFGGACVFFQCFAYLSRVGVKAADVVKMKITQSAIATIVCFLLCLIFLG